MRRHTRANPLVRRRLSKLIEDLKSEAPRKWPRRFNLAWVILHDELNLAEQPARSVLDSSASAAHACARSINRRVVWVSGQSASFPPRRNDVLVNS